MKSAADDQGRDPRCVDRPINLGFDGAIEMCVSSSSLTRHPFECRLDIIRQYIEIVSNTAARSFNSASR
jgi:hypothetical protein